MEQSLREFCIETQRQALLAEWDTEKNGSATPDTVSYRSQKAAWWRCSKGHSWKTRISTRSRSRGADCPFCTGKLVIPGETDLASTHPELAAQWHPTLNEDLTPQQISAGSKKAVWWQCDKGHAWQARLSSRVEGNGCPYCANRAVLPGFNDLSSQEPEVTAQWHPTLNDPLSPEQVSRYSNQRVWWQCDKGHAWQAPVFSRTAEQKGCPYCTGKKILAGWNDLQTREPEVAAQWHPTLNGELTPQQVSAGSKKRVWWQCANGHVWQAFIYSRTGNQRCGCPVCAGTVRKPR